MALEIWPKIGLSGKIRFVASYLFKKDTILRLPEENTVRHIPGSGSH